MRALRHVAVAAIVLGLPLAACGDTEDDDAATDGADMTEGGAPEATEGSDDGAGAASALSFSALDIEFDPAQASGTAGDLTVTLTNEGQIEHSWLVEDHEDDLRLHVAANGDTDEGTISLEPGEYTYYCDVTGHRSAGMEGTLTIE